jgi:hypothetical protein
MIKGDIAISKALIVIVLHQCSDQLVSSVLVQVIGQPKGRILSTLIEIGGTILALN